MDIRRKNSTIDFIRIFACLLILWNHISADMLDGRGNPLHIANIGVQIFFFMSGYLYGGKNIGKAGVWIKRNCLKICIPYWIYLVVILPVIALLDNSRVTWAKAAVAFLTVQGYAPEYQVDCLGQHWYISYILLCYLLTPAAKKLINTINGKNGKLWKRGGTGCTFWLQWLYLRSSRRLWLICSSSRRRMYLPT